jgi:hypothetical protein
MDVHSTKLWYFIVSKLKPSYHFCCSSPQQQSPWPVQLQPLQECPADVVPKRLDFMAEIPQLE